MFVGSNRNNAMNATSTFFSWNTTSKNGLFVAVVTKNESLTQANAQGRYCESEVIKTAAFSSRAKAVGYAKKLVRYYTAA